MSNLDTSANLGCNRSDVSNQSDGKRAILELARVAVKPIGNVRQGLGVLPSKSGNRMKVKIMVTSWHWLSINSTD